MSILHGVIVMSSPSAPPGLSPPLPLFILTGGGDAGAATPGDAGADSPPLPPAASCVGVRRVPARFPCGEEEEETGDAGPSAL
eukprot:1194019-Prorocentrum_minimum.AAC.2